MRARADPPNLVRRRTQTGFTLLEIMVALVVMTLILTSAFGALRLGQRSWEAGVERANATEDLRMISGLLRREFHQILPLTWLIEGENRIAFSGDSRQVRFIAPAPQRRGAGGLFEFSLTAEPREASTRLILSYRLFDPGVPGFSQDQTFRQVILADGLKEVSLRYYGQPDKKRPPAWHERWDTGAERFPRLVHLQVSPGKTQAPWPDLYLALAAGWTQ